MFYEEVTLEVLANRCPTWANWGGCALRNGRLPLVLPQRLASARFFLEGASIDVAPPPVMMRADLACTLGGCDGNGRRRVKIAAAGEDSARWIQAQCLPFSRPVRYSSRVAGSFPFNRCRLEHTRGKIRAVHGLSERSATTEMVQLLGKPDHCRAERPRTRSRPFGDCSPALRSWLMFYVGPFSPQPPTPSCQRTSPLSHGSALSQASFTIIVTGLLTPASRLNGLKPYGSDPASGVSPAPNGPTPVGWGVAEAAWLAAGSNGQENAIPATFHQETTFWVFQEDLDEKPIGR